MTLYPNGRELSALRKITYLWEDRAKLGAGKVTFAALLENGWIKLFEGHNPRGERYSITEAGQNALRLGLAPKDKNYNPLRQFQPNTRTLR